MRHVDDVAVARVGIGEHRLGDRIGLMTLTHALRQNLAALDELPCAQVSMAAFKQVIGWEALEQRQQYYEAAT